MRTDFRWPTSMHAKQYDRLELEGLISVDGEKMKKKISDLNCH